MSKTVRAPRLPGANVQLRESLKRLEGRVRALEIGFTEHTSRIDAVEVVKAGPQETDQDLYRGEPELPFDAQKPETE